MEVPKHYKVLVPSQPSRNEGLLGEYFKDTSVLPRRVDGNPINRLLLLPQAIAARDFDLLSAVVSIGEGKYVPRPNIYLLTKGASRFVELHEETHGLSTPLGPYAREMTFTRLRNSMIEGDAEYFTKFVVYHCLNEGIADFVAIDIALRNLDPEIEAEGVYRRNKLLYAKGEEGTIDEYNQAINLAFECLSLISQAKDLLLEREFPLRQSLGLGRDTMSMISKTGYVVGYYFVAHAMNRLLTRGLDKKDALELLIKNPPADTNQLEDPFEYVEKVLN